MIYKFENYKEAIKQSLIEKKKLNAKITFERMAASCRVQKTYLSKVLNHDGDLNSDQLFLACKFLEFNPEEIDFVLKLFEMNLTHLVERKNLLQKELSEIRKSKLNTQQYLNIKNEKGNMDEYYLDPDFQIIHMFLTIERFSKNVDLIVEAVGLKNKTQLIKKINKLVDWGLVKKMDSKWGPLFKVIESNLHLPDNSKIFKAYKTLLRLKSLERCQNLDSEKSYNFSVVFSSNPKVRNEILEKFLKFTKEIKDQVEANSESEVYQLNFDLHDWS